MIRLQSLVLVLVKLELLLLILVLLLLLLQLLLAVQSEVLGVRMRVRVWVRLRGRHLLGLHLSLGLRLGVRVSMRVVDLLIGGAGDVDRLRKLLVEVRVGFELQRGLLLVLERLLGVDGEMLLVRGGLLLLILRCHLG